MHNSIFKESENNPSEEDIIINENKLNSRLKKRQTLMINTDNNVENSPYQSFIRFVRIF